MPGATDGVEELANAAASSMQAGRLDEAARLWERVLALQPEHPRALLHLGQHQLYRKDATGARTLLERAALADPANPFVPLNLAHVFRAMGDCAGEMEALTRALTIDPYFLPALLAKGALLERLGKRRLAAKVYADALSFAPADSLKESWLAKPLENARAAVQENRQTLNAYLGDRLAALRRSHGAAELVRFEECKDVMIGAKKVFTQQPTLLHFPHLPALTFYDNRDFPWLAELEAATAIIQEDLNTLLREDAGGFEAYVKHPDGVPLNQWAELNRSLNWSAYFLWSDGKRIDAHCARCSNLTAVLEKMPMAVVPDAAPSAFFSALSPGTLIPPHTGATNTRLIVHLPLVVPEGCWFRVGNDKREWQVGKAWVFDDTMEHEAYNGSDRLRIMLIFDIWNPYLTPAERQLVCELLAGVKAYYAQD
jgi:tetratricopeptide (TPR) repeat protein